MAGGIGVLAGAAVLEECELVETLQQLFRAERDSLVGMELEQRPASMRTSSMSARGFGKKPTKQSWIPNSIAVARAYSLPPVLHR